MRALTMDEVLFVSGGFDPTVTVTSGLRPPPWGSESFSNNSGGGGPTTVLAPVG